MTEKKAAPNPTLFRLNCFLALHQHHCYLFTAGMAAVGVLAIIRFDKSGAGLSLFLLIFFLTFFQKQAWAAPIRALNVYMNTLSPKTIVSAFAFVAQLEKSLPLIRKRTMAYYLTMAKAILLFKIARFSDALSVLRGFNKPRNAAQKQQIDRLITQIEKVQAELQDQIGEKQEPKQEQKEET